MPNPNCSGTVTVTCVFAATGSFTAWRVPFGVTSLTVTADGASGASASSTFTTGGGAGGLGGEYQATLAVWSMRSGSGVTLFARLTANGEPVPRERVSFSTGVIQWCAGEITSSSGVASCSLSRSETALLRDQFGVFSAYFGGDTPAGLPPGSATGVALLGGFFF